MSDAPPLPELAPLSDPLSLARISVLLVPVGDISRSTWDKWTSQIRRFTELRLNDVPGTSGGPASKGDKARFLPPSSPPPNTHVHLAFTTVPPTNDLLPLSLLQVSAFPLAVIGVADLSDTRTNHNQKIGQFQQVLNDLQVNHANGMVYPLARRCFGVEEDVSAFPLGSTPKAGNFPKQNMSTPNLPDSSSSTPRRVEQSATFEGMVEIDASDDSNIQRPKSQMADRDVKMYDRKGHEEKMVVIPKDGNVEIVLGMLMADLVASILTEFGDMVSALEKPAGTQTLQASMLPTLTVKSVPKPVFPMSSASSMGDSITRPRSTNYSLISVSNTANPATPTSVIPSRPSSATGYTVPGVSGPGTTSAVPEIQDRSSGRPQSVIGTATFGGDATLRGFGNVPGPAPAKNDSKPNGNASKRASTGFSLSTSMGRVMSGSKHLGGSIEVGSSTSPVGGVSSNTATSSATGRLKKVTADLWLLSGRLQEAIASYQDCLPLFKSQADNPWHASACEGLATATLLEAWETRDSEHGNVPFLSSPVLSGAHEYLMQGLALYGKSSCPPESLFPHGAESGEGVMARLYTLCALRTARLLLHSWAAGGFGAASVQSLISGRMARSYPPADYAHRRRVFLKLTTMSKISRSLITRTAAMAHGPWTRWLPDSVQLDVLVELANMQRILGLDRREMIFDRELSGFGVTSILKTRAGQTKIVQGTRKRNDSDTSERSQDSALSAETTASSIASSRRIDAPASSSAAGFIASKRPDSEEGTDAILNLLHRTLDVLGLDLDMLYEPPGTDAPQASTYGWPELQVEFVRDAVTAVEALPDHLNIMRFTAVALRTMSMHLAPHSQLYLYQAYARAWSTAQRRAIALPPRQWWIPDGLLVRLEITPMPANKIPYEQSLATATAREQRLDPFLYNPRAKTSAGGKLVFVQDESIECVVTLANPFSFDIELQDVALATTGVATNCPSLALVLTADSVVRVSLVAVASEPGELAIQGIRIRLPDGQSEILSLPQVGSLGARADQAKDQRQDKPTFGTDSRPGVQRRNKQAAGRLQASNKVGLILCQVIPSQPLMWIRGTNLNHGSLISLDGEASAIRLIVENASSQPINFLKLTFTDTLSTESELLLNEAGLDPIQAHMVETELRERPVLLWEQADQPVCIPPGAQQSISIRYFGKFGCEHAVIRLDYGNIADANSTFYSRRIALPIITTVEQTLTCQRLNIQPIGRSGPRPNSDNTAGIESQSSLRSMLPKHQNSFRHDRTSQDHLQAAFAKVRSDADTCLGSAVFTNPSDQALEVCLELIRGSEGEPPLILRRLLAARASARLVFPLKRCSLSYKELSLAIPQSDIRQFVVSKRKTSDKENYEAVEHFWYKQELLKSVRAWWTLPGSNRSGEIGFHRLGLDRRAVDAFRQASFDIDMNVEYNDDSGSKILSNVPTSLCLKINTPGRQDVQIATYIVDIQPCTLDRSSNPQHFQTDLDAVSRNFIYEGELSGSLALLDGTAGLRIRSTFLSKGLYELDLTVNLEAQGSAIAANWRRQITRTVRIV